MSTDVFTEIATADDVSLILTVCSSHRLEKFHHFRIPHLLYHNLQQQEKTQNEPQNIRHPLVVQNVGPVRRSVFFFLNCERISYTNIEHVIGDFTSVEFAEANRFVLVAVASSQRQKDGGQNCAPPVTDEHHETFYVTCEVFRRTKLSNQWMQFL